MALDVTVGGASANSYATVAEADAYNAARPFSTDWAGSDDVKGAALQQAARLLDSCFNWTGSAVDATQALTWPRNGMSTRNGFAIANTVIPKALKDAQCEWARQLLVDDRTSDLEQEKQNLAGLKIGPIDMKFRNSQSSNSLDLRNADIIARLQEFDYLWKAVPDAVRNLLPPSWYVRETITKFSVQALR